MSRFTGQQGSGAMRAVRKQKKAEAQERNARTPYVRTRQYRRDVGLAS
jgi:hypothetical protein